MSDSDRKANMIPPRGECCQWSATKIAGIKDVHTEHCCLRHGCCYGNPECSVTTKFKKQSYPCETCEWVDKEEAPLREIERLRDLLMSIRDEAGSGNPKLHKIQRWADEALDSEKRIHP